MTLSEPVMPPPPLTFSMMSCWPSTSERCGCRMRPSVSTGPPAANGTTMVSVRAGHSSAARLSDSVAAASAKVPASTAIGKRPWRISFLRFLQSPRASISYPRTTPPHTKGHGMPHDAARLKVLSARAVHVAVGRLSADFSHDTGRALDIDYAPVGVLQERLAKGETADVIILSVAG